MLKLNRQCDLVSAAPIRLSSVSCMFAHTSNKASIWLGQLRLALMNSLTGMFINLGGGNLPVALKYERSADSG